MAPLELFLHIFLDHVHGDMTGAFVHDLDTVSPSPLGEVALNFEFSKLGIIIGVGDRAWAESVADGKADIVSRHNFANFIPMSVGEIFLVMREAPFGEDRATAADDSRHAFGGHGDEAEEYPGVDGEVVDALFCLFDEGIAVEFPGEVFGFAVDFFEGLINGDRSDGDGGVAENPLASGVDIFPGAEIHHGVGAPFGRPAHFFHFFVDGGSDRTIADIGVNFDEKISADDHRFEFGVIDICGDDGASAGDFVADKFWGDVFGDSGAPGLAWVLLEEGIAGAVFIFDGFEGGLAAEIFADGDVLHFWGDDSLAGIPELGYGMACAGAEGATSGIIGGVERGEAAAFFGGLLSVTGAEVAVVLRDGRATGILFHIAARGDPRCAHGRQSFLDIAGEIGIAPRTATIIDANWLIDFDGAVEGFGWGEGNFAEGNADLGVDASF